VLGVGHGSSSLSVLLDRTHFLARGGRGGRGFRGLLPGGHLQSIGGRELRQRLLSEGFLLAANGRRVAAYRTAREVVADEPENLQGWFLARQSAPNRRAADAAQRRLEQLSPFFDSGD